MPAKTVPPSMLKVLAREPGSVQSAMK
jgi:hypothetical protein